MFVKDYMTRHPIMIGPKKKVLEAQELMSENGIRHLPVAGDGKRIEGWSRANACRYPLKIWAVWRFGKLRASCLI